MNLAGKYSNCRLKMMIGAIIGSLAAIIYLSAYLFPTHIFEEFPMTFAFSYFFTLIGGDHDRHRNFGLSRPRPISSPNQGTRTTPTHLRERMYEAYASN